MLPRLNSNKILQICILSFACNMAIAEDLAYIVNLGLDVDATLIQARETQLATVELLPQARAGLLPTLSGTAGSTYTNTNNPLLGRYNTFTYGASLSQQLFNVANWQTYRQADIKIKSAIASYEDAIQDLLLRISNQYFAILKALDDLHFSIAERKAFSRHLEETQQKFNAGVIAITDVNEAQAKYDGAVAQEITAKNELYNQKEIMGEITGIPAGNISLLKSNIVLQRPKPDDIEYWVRTAVSQNYALQAKRFDAEAAKKDISIARAANYPTLEADGSTNKAKSAPPAPVVANTNTIGVTLTLPLFSGGKILAKTRQAEHQYQIAIEQAINVERQIKSNVRQAFRGILTQISQIKALQQSVISSKSALDATQAAFEVGTRTIVDVLNSQSDLLNAQSNLSKARYDYIIASFKLKRYAGILTLEDINIINKWLQPAPKDEPGNAPPEK
jgi:outer membrane protein